MLRIIGNGEQKMMSNKIESLIERVRNLKKDKKSEISDSMTEKLEKELCVILPNDFKVLCRFYGYDYFSYSQFYSFSEGVILETKYWREQENLPHEYIVLSSDDASFELIKTISDKECRVIICDYQDFFNLCERGNFMYETTTFKSFTDFYEFLLTEEESYRAESKK
jgi:hypothetical protein